MISRHFTHRIDWQGITVEVVYEPNWWLSPEEFPVAHLQVRSIAPERAPLPVTKTSYLSHFPTAAEIADRGGPAMYVREWMDEAAMAKTCRDQQKKARQLRLL